MSLLPQLIAAWLAASPAPLLLREGEDAVLSAPEDVPDPVAWFSLDPIAADYDNVKRCGRGGSGTCHDPLRWRRRRLPALDGARQLHVAELPDLGAPGTHRLVADRLDAAGGEVGEEVLEDALTIVVRAGDDYVGLASELIGVPFVYWPDVVPGAGHQTDARLGADCVALVIYGRRRMGCDVPYLSPASLARRLLRVPENPGGSRIQAGDVLHFGFQTAVIARDHPPLGVLDASDEVLHAYHGLVERTRFGALPYRYLAHELLRWGECRLR